MNLSDLRVKCHHELCEEERCSFERIPTIEDLGGQEVWWCLIHFEVGDREACTVGDLETQGAYFRPASCRMVKRILLDPGVE